MSIAMPETPRALVVDDEPGISEMISDALQDEGYEVSTARNAAEAFERMRKEDFGLLVLDVMLPDMDGILVHNRVKALDPQLARQTIFISGWTKAPEVHEYLESVGTFLPKPFSIQDLLKLARSLN